MRIESVDEYGNKSFLTLERTWVNVRIGYVRTDEDNSGVLYTVLSVEITPKEPDGPCVLTIQEGGRVLKLLEGYVR